MTKWLLGTRKQYRICNRCQEYVYTALLYSCFFAYSESPLHHHPYPQLKRSLLQTAFRANNPSFNSSNSLHNHFPSPGWISSTTLET
jgi:hypothetical protein